MADFEDVQGRVGPAPLRLVLAHPSNEPTPISRLSHGSLRRALQTVVSGVPSGRRHPRRAVWDVYDGGQGRVHGTVTVEGTPAERRVRLFDARTGRLLRATWSAPDGGYTFDFIARDRDYIVITHDHTRQFNAVIADSVRAEHIP